MLDATQVSDAWVFVFFICWVGLNVVSFTTGLIYSAFQIAKEKQLKYIDRYKIMEH